MLSEKRKLQQQEWRKKNQEKCKEYSKTDREKNKEKIAEKRKTPEYRQKMLVAVKRWRLENRQRYLETEIIKKKRDRLKINCRFKVINAIRRGKMIRGDKCEICGKQGKMEAHHGDYKKPLEVKWLCTICHRHKHNKLLDIKP